MKKNIAKPFAINKAKQWKVIQGVSLDRLERTCDQWTEKGWDVFAILGPFSSGLAVVLWRIVTL